jgi:hypothetical protein
MKKITFVSFVLLLSFNSLLAQFSGGNGTSGNPYLISSSTDLASITGSYITGGFYFKQTANIDIASYLNWTPIGTSTSPFSGFYDGNGKTISNLKISANTSTNSTYRGLFGATSSTTVISNLSLTSVSVLARNYTGALAGQNRGKIFNCSSVGTVTGRTPTGGLVGYNLNTGEINNCFSNCVVAGYNNVGGLVGQNEGTLSYSYATGSLSASAVSYANIAGLVGTNSGSISQCFATVDVTSVTLGALGGCFVANNSSSGTITNCYSNGTVEVDEDPDNEAAAGGFVVTNYGEITNCYSRGSLLGSALGGFAVSNSGTINNCFWDEDTFGPIGSNGGTAATSAEMQDISTYTTAGWPFQCQVWGINGSDNDLYPFLLWQVEYDLPASDCNYWTGSTSSSWSTGSNWSGGVPTSGSSILIRSSASNFPIVSSSVSLNVVNVGKNAYLTISSTGELTSTGQFQNNGFVTLNPTAKMTSTGTLLNNNGVEGLLIQSNSSGSATLIHSSNNVPATVQRYVHGTQYFHVVTSPVSGQTIRNFISENTGVLAYNAGQGVYAMRHYTAGTGWSAYYTATQTGDVVPGTAYTVGHAAPGTFVFKGLLVNTTQTKSLSGVGTGWNGIGNPFAAALHVNNGINSFFQKYKEQFDINYRALYIWDPITRQYQTINGVPGLAQNYLSSAQGFLVKSLAEGSTVYFETAMRAHQNPTFFKAEEEEDEWHNVILRIESVTGKRLTTALAFNKNMTTDFDVDFDAGYYSENQNFKFYSRMPIEGNELNLSIQALPDSWLTPLIIPLGMINTEAGVTVLSAASMTLPTDVKVILEDRVLNIFTDLTLESYTFTIDQGANPFGRFYLHISNETTSLPNVTSDELTISIYPNPNSGQFNASIRLMKPSSVEFILFDVSGRKVMGTQSNIYPEGESTISLNTGIVLPGVYLLKVVCFDADKKHFLYEKVRRVLIKSN